MLIRLLDTDECGVHHCYDMKEMKLRGALLELKVVDETSSDTHDWSAPEKDTRSYVRL